MTLPATSRQTRTFDDRADALAHFFLRAGEAPRLLAYDDATGCPLDQALAALEWTAADRKSTRLNSSHDQISYAVFCLKKKKTIDIMGLPAAYANLDTAQERGYFMQRNHGVISLLVGHTTYDADYSPLLVMLDERCADS